jgi:fatty-acyl-CoA synthase
VLSTMQDFPLTISHLLRHGQTVHGRSQVATFDGKVVHRASFSEVADRAERLAAALTGLGIGRGDRVATFCWNHQAHLEAYLAVPSMGAVLHTLNIRLFREQMAFVVNHAEDRVVIIDDSLVPVLARVAEQLKTVEHYIVIGAGDAGPLSNVLRYDDLLAGEHPGFSWPDLDERSAAAMCHTSGTTGDPRGVTYSHRSTFLHSMSVNTASVLCLDERDKVLVIVPMFHANAWGIPYAGWMAGADFVMPDRFLQAEPLARLIALERPTLSSGVPTIWNDVLQLGKRQEIDLSSFRLVTAGGAAVPRSLMEQFQDLFGVRMIQGWGMTETSPVCAIAYPPKDTDPADDVMWRSKTGRVIPGVELRIVAEDGTVAANDGRSLGEIEARGPWVTGAYYLDPAPERFHDGWLRTGDVGTMDDHGFIQITDRSKDVIKSGGEWISSVELENVLMAHPDVIEASVIGVADGRWDERPLACVVLRPDATVTPDGMREWLASRVISWWVPERWAFLDEIPKTSVGKFDKKTLRARQQAGELDVQVAGAPVT